MRGLDLQPPVNVSASDGALVAACKAASPVGGIIAGAMIGSVVFYFMPKLLDKLTMGPVLDDRHGEPVDLEIGD